MPIKNINIFETKPVSNNSERPLNLDAGKDLLESEDVEIISNIDKCLNIIIKILGIQT